MRARFLLAAPLLTLAACGGGDEATDENSEMDPATAGALGEDILVDPDRLDQTGADGALAGGDPASSAVPMDDETREQVNRAREEARQLVGGRIAAAPEPGGALTRTMIAAAQAIQRGNSGVNCAQGAEYSTAWADRLPEPFTVYPRGAVLEAAGNDDEGCALRVATFTTAVPPQEVVNFYHARARSAGFSSDVMEKDGETVLGGRKGDAAFYIAVARQDDGRTKVELLARAGS